MHTFRDNKNREWSIDLTFGAIKRVKSLLQIDLLAPEVGDPPLLVRLGTDPVLLVDTVFAIVQPQAESRGVSDLEFAEALGADAEVGLVAAFYDEWRDFFHRSGRPHLEAAIAKQRETLRLAIHLAQQKNLVILHVRLMG